MLTCNICKREFKNESALITHFQKNVHTPLKSVEEIKTELVDKTDRPKLIQVGKQFINPIDISAIRYIRSNGLYIIDLKSQPSPKFALWVKAHEIGNLIQYFNIIGEHEEVEEVEN